MFVKTPPAISSPHFEAIIPQLHVGKSEEEVQAAKLLEQYLRRGHEHLNRLNVTDTYVVVTDQDQNRFIAYDADGKFFAALKSAMRLFRLEKQTVTPEKFLQAVSDAASGALNTLVSLKENSIEIVHLFNLHGKSVKELF